MMSTAKKIDKIGKQIAKEVTSYWYGERIIAGEIVENVLDTLIKHGILNPQIKDAYLEHI